MHPELPKPFLAYRLLAVIAHPDDEAYAFSGALALSTGGGARAMVASATRGEGAGRDRSAEARDRRARQARLRSAELKASCAVVGAAPPFFLDLPDGGVDRVDRVRVIEKLLRLFRETRPDVVLTHGADGAYGHRDHVALASLVPEALSAITDRPMPRLLHAAFPQNLFRPVWQRLRRSRPFRGSVLASRPEFGCPPEAADLRIELRPVAGRKVESIRCHASQLPDGEPRNFLLPGLIDRLLREEWYQHGGGPALPDAAADLFAGLS